MQLTTASSIPSMRWVAYRWDCWIWDVKGFRLVCFSIYNVIWSKFFTCTFHWFLLQGLHGQMQQKEPTAGTLIVLMIWYNFFSEVLCLTFFVSKFHWSGSNSLSITSIWSISCIYNRKIKKRSFFKTIFFQIALISKRFELQMPDWSQIVDNLM